MDERMIWAATTLCVFAGLLIYQHVLLRQRMSFINRLMYAMRGIEDGTVEVYRDTKGAMRFKQTKENNNGNS